jgi:hypothetical protein
MNDEQLIWEAYKNSNQSKISPLKQFLIDYVEGTHNIMRSIENFRAYALSVKEGLKFIDTKYGKEEITPQIEEDVHRVAREMMDKNLEDLTEDEIRFDYPNYEHKVEAMMYNAIDELKRFGFSEDKAQNLLEDLVNYSEANKNDNIRKILEMDL